MAEMVMRAVNDKRDFYVEVMLGIVPGHSWVQKFGKNQAVATTIVPIAIGGVYQTPTTAVTLEVISDDADDAADGTGARNIILQGFKPVTTTADKCRWGKLMRTRFFILQRCSLP